jgi:hypothetical protein
MIRMDLLSVELSTLPVTLAGLELRERRWKSWACGCPVRVSIWAFKPWQPKEPEAYAGRGL